MELKIFSFIDEALEFRNNYLEILEAISEKLNHFFLTNFKDCEGFLNVTSRVKSEQSIREKLIRNNFYRIYKDPQMATLGLSDLIGQRIECRFIKDEENIYYGLLRKFNIQGEDGYYRSSKDENIYLRLSEKQPQMQRNGFEIYKIDGYYHYFKTKFKFELQIKSMVNLFWGEIDHSVLYKNYNYMITEDFFRDIMYSIKDNLTMIDRQLMLLYNQVGLMNGYRENVNEGHLTSLMSKIIHDIYSLKVKDELGVVLDFKNVTDIIVEYLFLKESKRKENSYGKSFISIFERVSKAEKEKVDIRHTITFSREPVFSGSFTEKIGRAIMPVINDDFDWYLFFQILHELSIEDSYASELEDFCNFVRYKYSEIFIESFDSDKLSKEDIVIMENYILNYVADNFLIDMDINYLLGFGIQQLKLLKNILQSISCIESFDQNIVKIERYLKNYHEKAEIKR